MKKILTFLLLALLPLAAKAEVLPSLAGLATPNWQNESPLAGEDFAKSLEQDGDYEYAILEWKRITHNTANLRLKARAQFHIAVLFQKMGKHQQALATFEKFGGQFPESEELGEALYRMSLSADALKMREGTFIRNRLSNLFPKTEWPEKASYAHLWNRAYQGEDNLPDIGSERGKELLKQLEDYPARPLAKAWVATTLSFIPGLGHLYLSDWRTALMALLINAIFIAALFYSLRFKLWAYASIFGLIVSILYVGTMFSAHSLTHREALEKRIHAMDSWKNLHPDNTLEGIKPQAHVISPMEAPLWFYRNVIGRFDGERGNGYPVSSLYMKQAQEKFGAGLGTLMGVDRLLRDWREIAEPKARIYADGRLRYVDSLERNTFWLKEQS